MSAHLLNTAYGGPIGYLLNELASEPHPRLQLETIWRVVETSLKIAVAVHAPTADKRLSSALAATPRFETWWSAATSVATVPTELRKWMELRDGTYRGLIELRNFLAHTPFLGLQLAQDLVVYHLPILDLVLQDLPWLDMAIESSADPKGIHFGHAIYRRRDGNEGDLFPIITLLNDGIAAASSSESERTWGVYLCVDRPQKVIAVPFGGAEARRVVPGAFSALLSKVGNGDPTISEVVREAQAVEGRDQEITTLTERIRDTTSPPLWVHGGIGIGKSALLSRIAVNFENEGAEVYFCRFRFDDTMSVYARMYDRIGIAEGNVGHWIKNLRDDKMHIVVLDGLNEIVSDHQRRLVLQVVSDAKKSTSVGGPSSTVTSPEPQVDSDERKSRRRRRTPVLRWIIGSQSAVAADARQEEAVFPDGLKPLGGEAVHAIVDRQLTLPEWRRVLRGGGEDERMRVIAKIADRTRGLPLHIKKLCEDLRTEDANVDKLTSRSFEEVLDHMLDQGGISEAALIGPTIVCLLVCGGVALTAEVVESLVSNTANVVATRQAIERLTQRDIVRIERSVKPEVLSVSQSAIQERIMDSPNFAKAREHARDLLLRAFCHQLSDHVSPLRSAFSDLAVRVITVVAESELPAVVSNPCWLVDRVVSALGAVEALTTEGRDGAWLRAANRALENVRQELLEAEAIDARVVAPTRRFFETASSALLEAARVGIAPSCLGMLARSQSSNSPLRAMAKWTAISTEAWLWPLSPIDQSVDGAARNGDPVVGVAFDGVIAVSVTANGAVTIWDWHSGRQIRSTVLPGRVAELHTFVMNYRESLWSRVVRRLLRTILTAHNFGYRDGLWHVTPRLVAAPESTDEDGDSDLVNSREAAAGDCLVTATYQADTAASSILYVNTQGSRRYFHSGRVNAVAVNPEGVVMIGDSTGRVLFLSEHPPED